MSSSTAIPISPELQQAFSRGNSRFIVVRIQNEVLVSVYQHPQGGSLESDWSQIPVKVGTQACYVLVKVEPSKWVTITYVPETTSVKDKMIYAATKATLLNHLGYQHFGDDLHANNQEELSYSYYQGSLKPSYAYTHSEEIREVVNREENEERKFRTDRQAERGIGGYHSVSMPFDSSAENLVRGVANGTHTFVELAVNAAKNGISGISGKNASGSFSSLINTQEPRYYLIKYQGSNAFIYCCPPKSPQKLRMVYSTAKSSVMAEVKRLGFNVSKAGEISEASELNDNYLRDITSVSSAGPTRAARPFAGSGEVKAARQSIVTDAHPVYSLMGNSGQRTKKVVLPPPGAY